MYLQHFAMREPPFGATPNPRFLVNLPGHQRVLHGILRGLLQGDAFLAVTGAAGAGKTLLAERVVRGLGGRFVVLNLPGPPVAPADLRDALARRLGLPRAGRPASLDALEAALRERVASGRRPVALVDDAHTLLPESLETLRFLCDLAEGGTHLLQVVLLGEPALDAALAARPRLARRVSRRLSLRPMDRSGLSGYVMQRIVAAGGPDSPPFTATALRALHRASGGVPSAVNLLSHRALLEAWGCGDNHVRWRHVRSAVAASQLALGGAGGRARRRRPARQRRPR